MHLCKFHYDVLFMCTFHPFMHVFYGTFHLERKIAEASGPYVTGVLERTLQKLSKMQNPIPQNRLCIFNNSYKFWTRTDSSPYWYQSHQEFRDMWVQRTDLFIAIVADEMEIKCLFISTGSHRFFSHLICFYDLPEYFLHLILSHKFDLLSSL